MNSLNYDVSVHELDESHPIAEHPSMCNIRLKQHQLSLLYKCTEFEREKIVISNSEDDFMMTRIGILGDKVGSGKSYVILSMILQQYEDCKESIVQSYGLNKVMISKADHLRQIKTNLLVVPHSLCLQWEQYIKMFCPQISYTILNKSKSIEQFKDEDISTYDLVLVTATFYNRCISLIDSKSVRLRRVIYDEVDNMSIPSCLHVESKFYWFVTASYGNLLYPRGFCRWDTTLQRYVFYSTGLKGSGFIKNLFIELCNTLIKDYVKVLVVKSNESYIAKSIQLPEVQTQIIKCRTPSTINILNGLVDKHIMERLNAGDITGALQYVDSHNKTSEENIIHILIEKYMKHIHNIELKIEYTQRYEYENETDREAELQRLTRKKKEIEEKVGCIKDRIDQSETCSICFDDISNKTIASCCSNSFCFKCINMWINTKRVCPLCKGHLDMNRLLVVSTEEDSQASSSSPTYFDKVHESNDKLTNLENILTMINHRSRKVLIFSSYENTLVNIVDMLSKNQIRYDFLKGNLNKTKNVLEDYKKGSLNVLLVNTSNYGSGLNLENTTDIVMFHNFDNEIEKQVIGRAQRCGRTSSLNVWYLLHDNEMVSKN